MRLANRSSFCIWTSRGTQLYPGNTFDRGGLALPYGAVGVDDASAPASSQQ
jgi:hypothetical protein